MPWLSRRRFDDSEVESEDEFEDHDGLLRYLDQLDRKGAVFVKASHIVNSWDVAGVTLPLNHHGFVLSATDGSFLSIHFTRNGLRWKNLSELPPLPINAVHERTYKANARPREVRAYCANTREWVAVANDCRNWSEGLFRVMRIKDAPDSLEWVNWKLLLGIP